eukprot:219534-Chlamydomonas_euryale.AAC.1
MRHVWRLPRDACCACSCNVWVWNGNPSSEHYQECWLKHLAHPEAAKPASEGAQVEWTAGTVGVDIKANPGVDDGSKPLRPFHTVTSAQGSATHWQMRIHYYHFKKQRHACRERGRCEMGGFTRLLHSGVADDLMDEIPTMVVDPLPSDAVEHSWWVWGRASGGCGFSVGRCARRPLGHPALFSIACYPRAYSARAFCAR